MKFDYSLDYKNIDFRKNPEFYSIGKGEQGVLLVQPYKSEILPLWRFKTPEIAKESSEKIYKLFLDYLDKDDFVGADMARKFLQMGFTRSRRYANRSSGRKYSDKDKTDSKLNDSQKEDIVKNSKFKSLKNKLHTLKMKTKVLIPLSPDPIKAESAKIFYKKYSDAKNNEKYIKLKQVHINKHV